MPISAKTLRNLVLCEHRVHLDVFGNEERRDPTHPFTELLWSLGNQVEEEAAQEGGDEALNLAIVPIEDRERLTHDAMERGESLIYHGRLSTDELVGEPDFLRKEGDGYAPLDIKSGVALDSAGKPKAHYAAQLAMYIDLLERHERAAGRYAYIIDKNGKEVRYDFETAKGPRTAQTLWDDYVALRDEAFGVVSGSIETSPALSSQCAQCHWRTFCRESLSKGEDMTLVPELSRSRRTALLAHVGTLRELAALNPFSLIDEKGKSTVKGVGADMLQRLVERARLIVEGGAAYAKQELQLPDTGVDIVLDIENDTFRGICYLHGVLVREEGQEPSYHGFFADEITERAERDAFASALELIRQFPNATIFTYSAHEKTWWSALQRRYPDLCTTDEIADFFGDRCVDLYYGAIAGKTVWPTTELNLKAVATHLGFRWSAEDPSGTMSLVWFDEYVGGVGDAKDRLVHYNEEDCRATLAVLDTLRTMEVAS